MRKLPERWERHYRETFLGRLRLKVFEEITGAAHAEPDPSEVRLFLMEKRRTDSFLADSYSALLETSFTDRIRWDQLEAPSDFQWILHRLERKASQERFFIEMDDCQSPFPDPLGIVVRTRRVSSGGHVHTIMFFDKQFLEEQSVLGYVEIGPLRDPEPGTRVFSRDDTIPHSDLAGLAAPALSLAAANRKYQTVPEIMAMGVKTVPGPDGVDDPRFMELAQRVWLGEIECHELIVPLERVKPHDPAAALQYPDEFVQQVLPDVLAGLRPHMAVYWGGDRFVMCDDYPIYLAYRALGEELVPVVVLGSYPAEFGLPQRSGGPELLPDVAIGRGSPVDDEKILDLKLDVRLKRGSASKGPLMLYAIHARLCQLLENPRCTEREVHDFLASFPVILDASGHAVRSEVRLGKAYRVDLLIQYRDLERRVLLIELEAPSKRLLTRAGRPRAPITHAIQQVEDWLRWWARNPADIPQGIDNGVHPHGLVVAGRKQALTEDEQLLLLHLNQNRHVQLLTYDDLLDRLEDMIRNIEALDRPTPLLS
jgi:hypothetical protein